MKTFQKLSKNCYAFTAEGDPNTGTPKRDRQMWQAIA
jgi:hypothetical protein